MLLRAASPSRGHRMLGTGVTWALLGVALVLTLWTSALAQIPGAKLIGTWVIHQGNLAASLAVRPDSTFTVRVKNEEYMSGRAVRLAGDTIVIRTVNRNTRRPETQPFVLTLNNQKLTVQGWNNRVLIFKLADRVW